MKKQRLHIIKRNEHIILYDVENMELYIGDDSISKENLQSFKKQEEASTTSLDITDTSISMMNAADGKRECTA